MATGNTPDFSDFDPVATTDPFGGAMPAADADLQPVIDPASAAPQANNPQPKPQPQPKPKPPKPGWNVFVFMLMMCIVFLAVGCVLLVTELRRYNFEIQPFKPLF